MSLQETLQGYEKNVSAWLDDTRKSLAAVQKLQRAVQTGNLRDIERLRAAAQVASATAASKADALAPLAVDAEAYLRNEFAAELTEAAGRGGVSLFERDGVIYSYPVLVRPEPTLGAVRVDKQLVFTVLPTVLVGLLKKLQNGDAKARPERFIETLFTAYEWVRARERIDTYVDVPLSRVYEVLTLLPGTDYTLLDFTRDLYFLDISEVTATRKGYTVSLPASTATRAANAKKLPFVDRQGQDKLYLTIKFTPPPEGTP